MTEKEYRTHPAISRSELWRLNESPEKFKWFKDNPEPATPALLFGQLIHKLLLQAKTFGDEFAVAPDIDKRTKAGKEVWADFELSNRGKTIVTADMFDTAMAMVKKAYSYDAVCFGFARTVFKGKGGARSITGNDTMLPDAFSSDRTRFGLEHPYQRAAEGRP